jgi:ubiquitin-protein ligase
MIKDNENEKSLFEIFTEINNDCQMYLQTIEKTNQDAQSNENKTEIILVSNFVSFVKKIKSHVAQLEIHKKNEKIIIEKTTKTLREIYKSELIDEICQPYEEMNITAFDKLIKKVDENADTKFITGNSMRQIAKELLSHSKSLPLELESSIFYRYNPNNLKFHEFVIAAPEGTPYDSGCFHFRMYCSSEYPNKNPQVNIYTTGNGNVKFNPNLYADGKICLSILGTWSAQAGESWIPGTSTMMQIMISIQSLVLVSEPYFNEAGYEKYYGTENGKKSSEQYNHSVRLNCMKWAMIDMMKNPTKGFEVTIEKHFRLKAEYIKKICATWVSEAPNDMSNDFKTTYINLCKELDKLTKTQTDTSEFEKEKKPIVIKSKKNSRKIINV